jgi:predicted amidohydrolase YtcJ
MDIILYNAKIITVDKSFSIAEAVAIDQGRISRIGTNSSILKSTTSHTKKMDLNGRTVLPGLIDAHLHPVGAARSEIFEEIPDVSILQELLDYIKAQTKLKKRGEWIIHPRFFATRLEGMRPPTLKDLDLVAPKHPVFLNGSYSGIINSFAIKICRISRSSKHPGILKDPRTGEPTGIIRASAFPFPKQHIPNHKLTNEQEHDALERMLRRYNRVGFTSVTDGLQSLTGTKVYRDLKSDNRLPIRVCCNVEAPRFETRKQFAEELKKIDVCSGYGDEYVRIGALKFILDGGILTGTALMRQPWGDKAKEIYGFEDPDFRGLCNYNQSQVRDIVSIGNSFSWKMAAHCTGGGAVDMLLNAYENANEEKEIREGRFSIIHGNFYNENAIKRCQKLGVIADLQPAWFYKDGDAMKYILGDERIKAFLPLRSMLKSDMILNGGSDHMEKFDSFRAINPYNPFLAMWVAVTRKTERGTVIGSSEAISREEALKMYTINNAYGTFEEKVKGSIEVGKYADLIVISEDYLNCPVDHIKNIQVELTMVGGKIVYNGN